MLTSYLIDPTWHCRGEQANLHLTLDFAHRVQDPLDVLLETEFEHLISLIQHNSLDAGEINIASLNMIKNTARRANKDFDSILEVTNLRIDWHTTVHSRAPELIWIVLEVLESVGDLACELPSRRKNDGLNLPAPKKPMLSQPLNDRQGESKSLTRAS